MLWLVLTRWDRGRLEQSKPLIEPYLKGKKKGKRKKESMSSGWKNEREKKERKIMNKEDRRGLDRLKIERQSMQKFEESH